MFRPTTKIVAQRLTAWRQGASSCLSCSVPYTTSWLGSRTAICAVGRCGNGIHSSASLPAVKVAATRSFSTVTVHFTDSLGDVTSVEGTVGDTLLNVAHSNDIDLEGACGGELACSTCHLILSEDWYNKIIDEGQDIDEDEEDMLDLAVGLTDTSRLGCQVCLTEAMQGLEVTIPDEAA